MDRIQKVFKHMHLDVGSDHYDLGLVKPLPNV